jgi:hypothetical protein
VTPLLSSDEGLEILRADAQGSAEPDGGQLAAAQDLIHIRTTYMEDLGDLMGIE